MDMGACTIYISPKQGCIILIKKCGGRWAGAVDFSLKAFPLKIDSQDREGFM